MITRLTDADKWNAIVSNDESYDGIFFYCVKSTGIFCRPSCKSKVPRRDNVIFVDTKEEALKLGFRPCKRCRSDLITYKPLQDVAKEMRELTDHHWQDSLLMQQELRQLGFSEHRLTEIFREEFGMTPSEYVAEKKMQYATDRLLNSNMRIVDIAYDLGFSALSSFYHFFKEQSGTTPSEYRKHGGNKMKTAYPFLFGTAILTYEGNVLTGLSCTDDSYQIAEEELGARTEFTDKVMEQIEEYLQGKRTVFDIPYRMDGTDFQKRVWKALLDIPYGETRSYKQIAEAIGNPKASRAVGMANNRNPLLLIVPCHRVIGANGNLIGYAAGLDMKKALLEMEKSR